MFLWSPLIAKFGRRPIYVFSFVIYTIFVFASGACKTFGQQMACRIIMAFASGAGEREFQSRIEWQMAKRNHY